MICEWYNVYYLNEKVSLYSPVNKPIVDKDRYPTKEEAEFIRERLIKYGKADIKSQCLLDSYIQYCVHIVKVEQRPFINGEYV